MRGVRFTKAEAERVLRTAGSWDQDNDTSKTIALAQAIRKKLEAATLPQPPGVAAAPLQDALVLASRGKVVPVEANGFGRISRQATAVNATVAQATLLGKWIAGQQWLQGPLTIYTVLAKWPDWLARAKATAAPDGLEEGLSGHVGQGPEAKRPASTAGRRKAGIG